ncbi:MAG: hypothetical protein DRP64_17910, partial [Verrucomicrobia bacterium]
MKNIPWLFKLFGLVFILGITALPAFSGAPPLTEEFLDETLPGGGPWFDNSSTEGRIEIAYDDTDSTTQLVPLSMPSPQTTTGGDRHRGNYYACTTSGALVSQGIYLNRTVSANVTFFIYESSTDTGTYTLLASDTVSAGIGNGMVRSGTLNTKMTSGKFYLIGAAWDSSCTYYYKSGLNPIAMPLGHTIGGHEVNSAAAPPASLTGSLNTLAYRQEVTISTNRVMRMDDSVDG